MRYGPHIFVAGVVALHGCFNELLMVATILLRGPSAASQMAMQVLVGLAYGSYAGQVVNHCIWFVLWNWGGVRRVLLGGLAAFFLYMGLAVPTWYTYPQHFDFRNMVLAGILGLPAVLLAGQMLLWMMRYGLHWHICVAGRPNMGQPGNAMTIRGLLVATTAVAFAIAGLRFGLALDVVAVDYVFHAMASAATVVVLLGVPTMFLILWSRRFCLGWLCANLGVFFIPLAIAASLLLIFSGQRTGFWMEVIRPMGGFTAGYALCASTPLLAARLMGARLLRA
jgi:hypothetical protein